MLRKGQVGQTMTWMVATVIIIVISVVFLVFTNSLAAIKGVGFKIDFISARDSGAGTQQMLFAVLDEGVGDLVKAGDYSGVNPLVDSILEEFRGNGIECEFWVYDENGDKRNNLGSASGGKEVLIEIEGKEVWLQC